MGLHRSETALLCVQGASSPSLPLPLESGSQITPALPQDRCKDRVWRSTAPANAHVATFTLKWEYNSPEEWENPLFPLRSHKARSTVSRCNLHGVLHENLCHPPSCNHHRVCAWAFTSPAGTDGNIAPLSYRNCLPEGFLFVLCLCRLLLKQAILLCNFFGLFDFVKCAQGLPGTEEKLSSVSFRQQKARHSDRNIFWQAVREAIYRYFEK